jgi:hypothetical protein
MNDTHLVRSNTGDLLRRRETCLVKLTLLMVM